ncbi:MAG: hypothetical protein GXP35_16120 [Actinobacteria bacterium]|nr:hypothetical protein [Actinomycetota bacterium]
MNGIILGALATMWVVVLGWETFSNLRDGRRRSDPMRNFTRQLGVLGRAVPKTVRPANALSRREFGPTGAMVGPPASRSAAADRRRVVSMSLTAGLVVAGVAWFVTSAPLAGAAVLVVGGLLIGFTSLVMRRKQLAEERARKVTYLPTARRELEAVPARRRAN